MRKKDNMGAKLVELDETTVMPPDAVPKVITSSSKVKAVKRDEPGKKQHNQSEKCRRGLLKDDYERLRSVVPNVNEVQKQSTLGLLHKARILIRSLEAKEKKYKKFKAELIREQKYLKRRLDQLQHLVSGGAIGLGNTLLLSVPAPPPAHASSQSQLIYDGATMMSSEVIVPHILKRKQVLLTKASSHPQIVITEITTNNILQPESMCLMIDEMEHLEGVSSSFPGQSYGEHEGEEGEVIETEIIGEAYLED